MLFLEKHPQNKTKQNKLEVMLSQHLHWKLLGPIFDALKAEK